MDGAGGVKVFTRRQKNTFTSFWRICISATPPHTPPPPFLHLPSGRRVQAYVIASSFSSSSSFFLVFVRDRMWGDIFFSFSFFNLYFFLFWVVVVGAHDYGIAKRNRHQSFIPFCLYLLTYLLDWCFALRNTNLQIWLLEWICHPVKHCW